MTKPLTIHPEYQIGESVYLCTDPEQRRRIVIGIHIALTGLTYSLACGDYESTHYNIEITREKDIMQGL